MKALIVGGGIAGPVSALALQKAGIDSEVYEAYPRAADGIGGTLTVAPNGLDALQIIGAADAVKAVGLSMTRTVMADSRGKHLVEFDGLPDLQPSKAMWRGDLYRALHDFAVTRGVRTEYGKRLVDVEEAADGITARFVDGTSAKGDLLIGADGIHSAVRKLIDPNAPAPQNIPLLNFGAAADIAVPARSDAMYFVFGKRAFMGYWVQPDGRTAWFGNLPHAGPLSFAEANEVPATEWMRRLKEAYADDSPGREIIESTRDKELCAFGTMQIMPRLPHWYRGRMVLVGDSAHAPSSSSGQGASLATESAIELARCLRDIPDVSQALAAYERLRRPRVENVAKRAAKTNNTKAFGPFAVKMMAFFMPLAMKTFLTPEKLLAPEQRHHIDWDRIVTA